MSRATRAAERARPVREGLGDRAIITCGVIAGILLGAASLFSPMPERLVRQTTGIGAPAEPPLEIIVVGAIRGKNFDQAIELMERLRSQRRGRVHNTALLACVLMLADQRERAVREIESLVRERADGAASGLDADMVLDDDQRLDRLEGAWDVCQAGEGGEQHERVVIQRVAGGLAYMESLDSGETAIVHVYDARNRSWVRGVASTGGALNWFSGRVENGELRVISSADNSPRNWDRGSGRDWMMRITFHSDGSMTRTSETPGDDGLWQVQRTWQYEPRPGDTNDAAPRG